MLFLLLIATILSAAYAVDPPFGQLSVKDGQLVGADGKPAVLRGMSLFWSQWKGEWWNEDTVKATKCCFNGNVIRAPMAVDEGGYLTNPDAEMKKVDDVVQAAIKQGIYVIIDWHTDKPHQAEAVAFFDKVSKKYAGIPNVLYEDYNEPQKVDWTKDLKPYHEAVTAAIRKNDPKNVVIMGTPTWDQDVDVACKDPVKGDNLMYTLHFYAATPEHQAPLRSKAQTAVDCKCPLFVTEYGTTQASGDGAADKAATQDWYDFLEKNKISYVNWALDDKPEASAAFKPNTKPTYADECNTSNLSDSAKIVQTQLKAKVADSKINCGAGGGATPTPAPAAG